MYKQVTYSGMLWLLAAQLIVMLPFALNLPFWLIPVMLFSAGWRLRVIKSGISQPSKSWKFGLIGVGIMGLLLSGLTFPSLEAMSALLLLGFAFKSLEVVQKRDALVVIFTGFFLIALQFLYNQSISAALYGMLCMAILTAALIGIQQTIAEYSAKQNLLFNLNTAVFMLLQCLPLMLIIFVFAPRFQPFWSIPLLSTSQAKTGMTDRIAPGDIENLSQSTELAFRVTFKDEPPKQQELYWRGLVLNYFDGQEWRQFAEQYELDDLKYQLKNHYALPADAIQPQGKVIHYEVVYEKTGQPWLFSLTPSITSNADLMTGADYRLMNSQPLQAPLLLHLTSYPEQALDLHLDPYLQQLALQLPTEGNPQTRVLVQQLRTQYPDDVAYIQAVLARYSQQQFTYTLRPPAMGKDSIDSFLFEAKRGFCAHYAGSFVFMLRAAGIPARIVAGYQGGEWNKENNYLAVHQYDAHAWTEAWLEGKGWVRIDPTATIAPTRIEQNLESAVQAEQSFLANQHFNIRKVAWLNNWRKQLDAIQYHWQRWVLGYDGESQMAFLQNVLGELSIGKIGLVIMGLFTSLALLWLLALGLLKPKAREALEQQLYRRFSQRLAKHGIQRSTGQTPQAFAQQAAQAIPQWQTAIHAFTQTYENLCYLPESDRPALLQALKLQLNALK